MEYPSCHSDVRDDSRFCDVCGAASGGLTLVVLHALLCPTPAARESVA